MCEARIFLNTNMGIGNQTSSEWDSWNLTTIAKLIFFLIIGPIILMLNGAVIVAFVKYSNVRTPTNYFLLSLVTADVLFGVLTLPSHLLGEFEVFGDSEMVCIIINSPTLAIPCAALLSLISASIERYIAVIYPLRYQALNAKKNILLIVVLIWLYSILLGVLPIAGINNISARAKLNSTLPFCNFLRVTPGKYMGFVTLSTYVPGMIVLGAVNIRIFKVAFHQRKQIQQQIRQFQNRSPTNTKSTAMFVLFILGHIYFIAHIPFLLTMAIDYKYFTIDLVEEISIPFGIYVLTSCLVAVCPIGYPLVMAFGNRDIRTCILKLRPKRFRHNQSAVVNTVSVTNQNEEPCSEQIRNSVS